MLLFPFERLIFLFTSDVLSYTFVRPRCFKLVNEGESFLVGVGREGRLFFIVAMLSSELCPWGTILMAISPAGFGSKG